MQNIARNFSIVFLLLFAGVWGWIIREVIIFNPMNAGDVAPLPDAVITVAGFLASSVGAATAAILGIELQKISTGAGGGDGARSIAAQVRNAATSDRMIAAGVYVYGLVGLAVLITWISLDTVSPEIVKTFALGALGWIAGTFSATFKAG